MVRIRYPGRLIGFGALALLLLIGTTVTAAGTSAATGTYTGWLDASGTSFQGHTFAVEQPGMIRGTLTWPTGADLNLMLFDPSGELVTGAYSTSENPEVILYQASLTGTWKFGVKAKSGSSSYSLSIEFPDSASTSLSAIDRASAAGIAQVTKSYGTYVHDFDLDGDQDFLYNRHGGSAMLLYVNDGSGRFSVSGARFPLNDRHDCIWANLDENPLVDFYCAVGAEGGRITKANELWLQSSKGNFTLVNGAWGATDPFGRGREPAFLDVNNDGLLDLFVGNHYPRPDDQPTPNRFYRQPSAQTFSSAPMYGLDLEIGGHCAEPADFDSDGFSDLAVCAHGPSGGLKLYRNDAGERFMNVAASKGVTGQWCDASWVDLNGDARPDLTLMSNGAFRVMLQRPDGTFELAYQRSMQSAGCRFGAGGNRVAAGDVDLDGDQDLYVLYSGYKTGQLNLPDVFLVNDGTGTRFTTASIPQANQGSGFSVATIQADGDPPMEFLVTNGRNTIKGPIQLIDFIG